MKKTALSILCGLVFSAPVLGEVNIGVSISTTGPAASLGIPERNTVQLLPQEIAGKKINYHVLDDATDTTAAARNARKLINENQVDALIASTAVPTSAAVAPLALENKTPQITLAPFEAQGEEFDWVFTVPQTNILMASALVEHMKENGVKTLGYIGFSDAWGEDWKNALQTLGQEIGIELNSDERYNRTDSSVGGQVLRVISGNPDAVLIGATGTPAALPHTELRRMGYQGLIYHTHGVANQAFLRIGGEALNGAVLPVGPIVIWDILPDEHPSKDVAVEYAERYIEEFDEDLSPFGAYMYDAGQILSQAIPIALEQAEPGSEAFRVALRDALEQVSEVSGTHGVYTFSTDEHFGLDDRASVLVEVKNQKWQLLDD